MLFLAFWSIHAVLLRICHYSDLRILVQNFGPRKCGRVKVLTNITSGVNSHWLPSWRKSGKFWHRTQKLSTTLIFFLLFSKVPSNQTIKLFVTKLQHSNFLLLEFTAQIALNTMVIMHMVKIGNKNINPRMQWMRLVKSQCSRCTKSFMSLIMMMSDYANECWRRRRRKNTTNITMNISKFAHSTASFSVWLGSYMHQEIAQENS